MANVFATKSGNWSDVTVWNTGALPTSADDVFANNFVVDVDISPTVLTVRNTSGTGITAGGRFELRNGVTLTCTSSSVGLVPSNTLGVVVFSLASPASATLSARLNPGTYPGTIQLVISGTGTLNVNGNMNQTAANNNAIAISITAAATLNFTGNVTSGGTGVSSDGITLSAGAVGATIIITGDLIPCGANGQNNYCIRSAGACIINVTGNCYWSTGGTPNSTTSSGCFLIGAGSPTITIIGNVTGSNLSTNTQLIVAGGTLTIIGTITAGTSQVAVVSSGSLFVTGPLVQSTTGQHPISSTNWRWHSSLTPTYYAIRNRANDGYRNLWTSDNASSGAGQPATTNVRTGTVYGPTSEYTGTCAVPAAGSVALGVPVDNTTGTAILTAASIRSAVGLASANLDSQLAPLTNLDATVSSRLATSGYTAPLSASGTRNALGMSTANLDTQLAPLPNLDTTVSSRLAAADYTVPPTSQQNAGAVRSDLTTELARIDTEISSRSTFNPTTDVVAHVTLVDTTTDLTNPPVVPTPEQIAEQVRTELTPELDNLDATVSSRSTFNPAADTVAQVTLVETTTNLTNPPVVPTPEQIASEIRVELTPELNRIDTEISTRSTFNPASDIVSKVTLVDTTTDLTNPPVVPTPEQIALAVREELAPELDHMDVDVSTRLASEDYTDPPTPEQNALATRQELEPELGRLGNCATVDTTGQQIQNALSL